jgi:hypothetical protein
MKYLRIRDTAGNRYYCYLLFTYVYDLVFQGEEIRGGEHGPAGRHDPSQGGQAHHLPGGRIV